jgi:hypothetical protein
MCTGPETVANCDLDCEMCPDGMCTGKENNQSCPDDCM